MADNALVRILTALLKHQVKKLAGEDALGAIGEELTAIWGDKLDDQVKKILGEKSTREELEKAATVARDNFRGKVNDYKIEQWMVMLPIDNLPSIISAIEELPTASDESKLENALRETISSNWQVLSPEQVDNAVNSYLFCLRSALLPIEKQTLMVVGRSVLRTEEKVNLLLSWFEKYIVNNKQSILKAQSKKKRKKITKKDAVHKVYDEEIPSTNTIIKEGKFLQIVVSQMFRLAELLTHPEGVRARQFYSVITEGNKYRRFLNHNGRFDLQPYGALRPVISIGDQDNTFWNKAIPTLCKEIDPLRFIPFELDLTKHLRSLKPDRGLSLENIFKSNFKSIQNIQLAGSLRIYPPGTGIICLRMTVEFIDGIHIEVAGELARDIEKHLFIDPNNPEENRLNKHIFLEIINKVAETFFKDEMLIKAERRWQPPETMYVFRDFHGNNLSDKVNSLSRLMTYAPANNEKLSVIERKFSKALRTLHWQKEKVFYAVSKGVALVIIPISDTPGKRESQKQLMDYFINTRELIVAASYATKSFADRLDKLHREHQLDVFVENKKNIFDELRSLLPTMHRVMQAISLIPAHLHNFGRGPLMLFARELWEFDNPVDFGNLQMDLNYISDIVSSKKNANVKYPFYIPKINRQNQAF